MNTMQVNGETDVAGAEDELPELIAIRTKEFAPLLKKWRANNLRVPWACLLRDALKKELAPLAGKRHAHLVKEVAA